MDSGGTVHKTAREGFTFLLSVVNYIERRRNYIYLELIAKALFYVRSKFRNKENTTHFILK